MPTIVEKELFWEEHLKKFKASNLSRTKYCRENGIDYIKFGYWIKKLNPASSKFVPVRVQTMESEPQSLVLCTLELSGHILRIYDLPALSLVLERLA
jgi:hypothetical protein